MADLNAEFCGLTFKNPIIVSSIEPTHSLEGLKKSIDAGAGGAIVKTLTDMPQMMNLTRHAKYAILNETGRCIRGKVPRNYVFYSRSGFTYPLYTEWPRALREAQDYAQQQRAHIVASIGAGGPEGWPTIARTAEDAGVSMLELNFGCMHTAEVEGAAGGIAIGQDPQVAEAITARVVEAVRIPVTVKLTPQKVDLVEVARRVNAAGAAAVQVTSRYNGFAVDIETSRPYIEGPAGVGGPWIKPVTLRWVYEIYTRLGMQIAGGNGIFDWRDAIEFIMSGARVMQIGSVLMLKGYDWIEKVVNGINTFLDGHGYSHIGAIYGIAADAAATNYEATYSSSEIRAVIDDEKCTRCWNCVQSCFYGALSRGEDVVVNTSENCIGCELCYNVCPFDAISYASNQ